MTLKKEEFYSEEQWLEHKQLLKVLNARCHDCMENKGSLWVFYAIAEHRFAIKYHPEGGTTLYYEYPSFNNVRTLKELITEQVTNE